MLRTNNRKFSKGFGILEVLISGAIIIVVLGTLVFIARAAITNAQYMQERAQAVSLAAEAIETVRQNRDSNYIDANSATAWNMVGSNSTSGVFSYLDTNFYIPVDLINNRLRLNTTVTPAININGVRYTRVIRFSSISNTQLLSQPPSVENRDTNGFVAKVTVTWNGSGGKSGSVEVSELITNSRFVY